MNFEAQYPEIMLCAKSIKSHNCWTYPTEIQKLDKVQCHYLNWNLYYYIKIFRKNVFTETKHN